MPNVSTADQVVHEDLSPLYINLDKRQTPFLSRLTRGDALKNVELFSWTTGKYEDGRDNILQAGVPEGEDVKIFETDKQERLYGRPQKFRRTPHVTTEANEINDTPGGFGKYKDQVLKKTVEQRRNIEKRLLSDADSKDEDGIGGREFMGAGRFINDGVSVGSAGAALTFTDAQTAIPAAMRTPTNQIYTGNLNALDASGNETLVFGGDQLNAMLLARYDAIGSMSTVSGFVDALLKAHLAKLIRNQKNLSGYTPVVHVDTAAIKEGNYLLTGVDIINTDFGSVDINLVQWMPRTSTGGLSGRGYFFDMEHVAMRPSGIWLRHTQLEDQGGGPRGYIQSILGPRWGHPAAHLKIDPNVATGTF
jgi:hypothetical protein